jgi:hypothetical protein
MWKDKLKDYASKGSKYIAGKVNPTLTRITVDIGALAGIVCAADNLPDLSPSTVAALGGATAIGLFGLDRLVTKLLKKRDKRRPMSNRWQTATLTGLMAVSGYSLADNVRDIYQDIEAIVTTVSDSKPANVDEVSAQEQAHGLPTYRTYSLPDFNSVKLANKGTRSGDIQRTYRWKPVIDAVESKYGIPRGVIAGLIMQESFGDPLQPNAGGDGGIGLIHTQGTTAKNLGLDIYGTSESARDLQHGRQLKQLIDECNYVLECVAAKDGRAHPLKNLDAIARYMMQGYRAYGSWDAAIQWVHGPGFVNKKRGIRYLSRVKGHMEAFNTRVAEAEADFNSRNPKVGWNTYVGAFHKMCRENFGLEQYR